MIWIKFVFLFKSGKITGFIRINISNNIHYKLWSKWIFFQLDTKGDPFHVFTQSTWSCGRQLNPFGTNNSHLSEQFGIITETPQKLLLLFIIEILANISGSDFVSGSPKLLYSHFPKEKPFGLGCTRVCMLLDKSGSWVNCTILFLHFGFDKLAVSWPLKNVRSPDWSLCPGLRNNDFWEIEAIYGRENYSIL